MDDLRALGLPLIITSSRKGYTKIFTITKIIRLREGNTLKRPWARKAAKCEVQREFGLLPGPLKY